MHFIDNYLICLLDESESGAVDMRHPSHHIGVLDLAVSVSLTDFASLQKPEKIIGGRSLFLMLLIIVNP